MCAALWDMAALPSVYESNVMKLIIFDISQNINSSSGQDIQAASVEYQQREIT
jgi:hypothetical protein